ncbi:MAG: hypothetical protein EBY30_10835 [Rhodospirillales bacterium]|nr:hypothetical protein [Rhodospirillales bacterium]
MTEPTDIEDKLARPSVNFNSPRQVLADPALSTAEKTEVLDTLEQDARQLSEAASEGMGGGERSRLHEVLLAKETLEPQPGPWARLAAWLARQFGAPPGPR